MKITLDLPDDLIRRVRILAVREHKKLNDAIVALIERGLKMSRRIKSQSR